MDPARSLTVEVTLWILPLLRFLCGGLDPLHLLLYLVDNRLLCRLLLGDLLLHQLSYQLSPSVGNIVLRRESNFIGFIC